MLTTDSSVSARAGHTEGDCRCIDVGVTAVRAGVHRDDILAALDVRVPVGIIRTHCPDGRGIVLGGLVN